MKTAADLVLWNGVVLTMEDQQPEAQGLAVQGDRIIAVGTDAEVKDLAGPETRLVDLQGRCLLPGFIDAHSHFASSGMRMRQLDFWDATSLAEVLQAVGRAAEVTPPGRWILGRNWDETRWPEGRYLTRRDLDAVAPHHPVALSRVDYHMMSVNSRALELVPIPGGTPGLMVDEVGKPTGELKEQAAEHVWSALEPSFDDTVSGLGAISAEAHRFGVTSIHDVVDAREIRAHQAARARGLLGVRVLLMPREELAGPLADAGLITGFGNEWIRLGPVKLFADGSFGSRTAALHEPFKDDPGNRGMLVHGEVEFSRLVQRIHEGGFQMAIHAIGDHAIDHVLEALQGTLGRSHRADHRHRIEHFELPSEEALRRAKRLGIVASMQPNFVGRLSSPGGMVETRVGERYRRNNPYRRVLDEGIPLAFGSDHMPFGPLYGIQCAVNAPLEGQRIGVEEALRAYTLGGAYAGHEEAVKGSLVPGKLADMVVLGSDPRRVPGRIEAIPVEMTIVGGEILYKN